MTEEPSRGPTLPPGGSNKPLYMLLWCAGASSRIEWLLNNTRVRYLVRPSRHALLPNGTASNEALHSEINSWFRQTRQIHKATLILKFGILTIAKQLPHEAALARPTTQQVPSSVVLCRAATRALWTDKGWRAWCRKLHGGAVVRKADLPLDQEKRQQAEAVRQWMRRRPAAAPVKVAPRKRTAFTLRREHSVLSSGVKNTVFRKPASCQ